MEVHCEGCAGCCIDWRALVDRDLDHERRGPYDPLDDAYNLVALTRAEVRTLVDRGLADALRPRLWRDEDGVTVDGVPLASVGGRPAFYVGLRDAPKPVAPFGRDSTTWLPTCVFLDPETLQCRVHGDAAYPSECAEYPGHNLALDAEAECERVEDAFGGERLPDDEPPEGITGPLFGPQAVGQKVFVHPEPDRLAGTVDRLAAGELTAADRAEFVAVAAAASPGTAAVDDDTYERTREAALAANSWVGRAVADWRERADRDAADASPPPEPSLAERVEEGRGAPGTPGW